MNSNRLSASLTSVTVSSPELKVTAFKHEPHQHLITQLISVHDNYSGEIMAGVFASALLAF